MRIKCGKILSNLKEAKKRLIGNILSEVKLCQKKRLKPYIYTKVSTAMRVDGYFLEAQKTKIKAFALYNEYEIAGEYEDAGKSGKSIEGRFAFNRMMEDMKSGKDSISYVLVFKLSCFAGKCSRCTFYTSSYAGFRCQPYLCRRWH